MYRAGHSTEVVILTTDTGTEGRRDDEFSTRPRRGSTYLFGQTC
jgi:hypothetical protein